MDIEAENLDERNSYKLLTGLIIPRPIAWITTMSAAGRVNLAPFSAFNYVSISPPMVGVNISLRNGLRKDTAQNIRRSRDFVVNIASDHMIEAIHLSSRAFPTDISETETLNLDTVPSLYVNTPRLRAAPAALECQLHRTIKLSPRGDEFIIGKVISFHIRDDLINDYRIDASRLRPVGRLSGPNYTMLGEIVSCQPEGDTT